MKKKLNINFSWPALLSDFTLDTTQENFSRAKLAVFYKGETADHRYFSSEFSEDLIKTLPYTPIVSYYDADEDDFVGHATEQQILGIVDPTVVPTFETRDDGNEWCICDVVLYTERPDMVGELAKKVVGHNQSLELDPRSVKYVINYDEKKHFKNIEFTAGRFVGVSVLGKNQKPAFTGSEFFAVATSDSFIEKLKLLTEYCNLPHEESSSLSEHQFNGGQKMNLAEFIKLSWGEVAGKVGEELEREYSNDAYTYIVDMYDDAAIVRFYYWIGESKLMKVNYSINESGEVVLGEITEVHVTYEPVELSPSADMEQVLSTTLESNDSVTIDGSDAAISGQLAEVEDVSEVQQPSEEGNTATTEEVAQSFNVEETSSDTTGSDNTDTAIPGEMRVEDENQLLQQENSGATTFTESENAEPETNQQQAVEQERARTREEKINLINSFEGLDSEVISQFLSEVDNYNTVQELEIALLKAYKRNQEESAPKPMRAFAFAPITQTNADSNDSLDNWVRKNIK